MARIAAGLLMLAVTAAHTAAQQSCAGAIVEFRGIVETESQMGHVNAAAKSRIQAELAGIEEACRAGRDAEANRRLATLKSRHGYR